MIKYLYLLFFVGALAGVFIFLKGNPFGSSYKKAVVYIRAQEFRVDVAESMAQKAKGLGGREELAPDEGMLFVLNPPAERSFWMQDMLIPIDIIWIREGRIIGASENAEPEPGVPPHRLKKYQSPDEVDYVLEVRAGTFDKMNFEVGDGVRVDFR